MRGLENAEELSRVIPVKIIRVVGFLVWVAGGVWAEEKGTEEKKKEPAGLSVEEKVKVGRGMAFPISYLERGARMNRALLREIAEG